VAAFPPKVIPVPALAATMPAMGLVCSVPLAGGMICASGCPGLGSAKPIVCDAIVGSDLTSCDAVCQYRARLAWDRSSVSVRWRPPLAVAIVTQLRQASA
jgi:hypothetical protein